MSVKPKTRKAENAKDAPGSSQTIVSGSDFVSRLRGLSQADYARFCNIRDRVYEIRKLLGLHDLDTARLYKRFFDEPNGIGDRVIANAIGLAMRHHGVTAGTKLEKDDWRMAEWRRVVVWSSPLDLEAFDAPGGPTPNDVEAMLAPLVSFKCPDWSYSAELEAWVKDAVSNEP